MRKQLTAELRTTNRRIEEVESMLADVYHYCYDTHDVDILYDELEDLLDRKEEIETKIQ